MSRNRYRDVDSVDSEDQAVETDPTLEEAPSTPVDAPALAESVVDPGPDEPSVAPGGSPSIPPAMGNSTPEPTSQVPEAQPESEAVLTLPPTTGPSCPCDDQESVVAFQHSGDTRTWYECQCCETVFTADTDIVHRAAEWPLDNLHEFPRQTMRNSRHLFTLAVARDVTPERTEILTGAGREALVRRRYG